MIDSTRDIQKLSREMDIPLNATIELLTECNLRCIHCYIPNHSEKGLEDYQLFSLFRELREMHTLYLNLTGGEIFLKKNIMGLLEEARNMGFSVSLLSNATQIDERIIRRLAELRISSFGTTLFSLDSSIHDAITRVSGSLEKALLNIALLKEYNIKVEIKTPIMRQNLLHYGRIEHFCDENGFLFNPTPTITSKNDGDNSVKKSCVDDEQMDAIADMILRRTSETAEKILKT
ncbi:MAG TPA: hypothetical protein DCL69_08805, partial [Firmicutes bacterium]|nr:hypothetical protein [Bacillota bacterium]